MGNLARLHVSQLGVAPTKTGVNCVVILVIDGGLKIHPTSISHVN